MKACILAGGEGRRLRPLTSHLPKPMVPLLGKPLLHRIVKQLRAEGIRDMALTLMYLPDVIRDFLGDGSAYDASFFYAVEKEPMGTAGGVRACADFLRGDDCLVISGDAVFDFDLAQAFRFHREHGADVTIILNRQDNPTEYGLVQTDADGRIQRFAEKPAWSEVFTNVVNTGIYLLAPSVLERIPTGQPFDFSKDLFPMLLKEGARLYGCELNGYWCDIGDTAAYLRCSLDALNGRVRLANADEAMMEAAPGVWTAQGKACPAGVTFEGPVWLQTGAVVLPGAHVGPNVWLGAGAYVGENSIVSDSVVDGTLSAHSEAEGAIVCAGSCVGSGSVLCRGAVLGSGVRLGENCYVSSGVRIYPDIAVPPSSVVRATLTAGGTQSAVFEEDAITGTFGCGLSPELVSAIGSACAELPGVNRAALGCSGGADTQSLMQSMLGGMTSAGIQVLIHDVPFAAGAAAMPNLLGVPLSVFLDSGDELSIRMYAGDGRPIPHAWQRRLEGAVARGEYRRVPSISAGRMQPILGGTTLYAAAVACPKSARKLKAAVHGHHPAASALMEALRISGFDLPVPPALCYDGLTLSISRDGFYLTVADGSCRLSCQESASIVLLTAMLETPGMTLALPEDAPEAYEQMAIQNGASVIRLGRDGRRAAELYAAQPFTHDAIGGAVMLISFLESSGTTIQALKPLIPSFGTHVMELDSPCEKSDLMRMLAEKMKPEESDVRGGMTFRQNGGTIRVTPSAKRSALKILAEGFSEEIAREIAVDFAERAGRIAGGKSEKNRKADGKFD